MSNTLLLLVVCALIFGTSSLHLLDNTQAQIDALKAQQDKFENMFGSLVQNITQIERALNSTTNTDQKIVILENAINSQRQAVYSLSKVLIPPFNITKDGCEKMTDQQKVNLLDQLSAAREQVYQLRNITNTMPSCPDVQTIKRDIEKQIFFLNSIQSIIYTNCSMNVILSPTIWQTNIYAPNWILGNMTIDDLIQQYYQRSIRYDNITNCPIDFPFYNGKQCIQCSNSTPAFDIFNKICVACPKDTYIDNSQKKCVPNTHYTNWTNVNNFYPKEGPFPIPANGSTPCPANAPYFNGTDCIPCALPNYFNIPTQTCVACPAGQIWNLNQNKCTLPLTNMLTKLSGTRWVTPTPNVTNVLTERANILAQNATTGQYNQCPENTPYFDGITCISCPNQFSLQYLNCTQSPSQTMQFDPNVHVYLPTQSAQTDPNATNLIGQPDPLDPNTPVCNSSAPYFDGVACIACPQPFNYFDVASKRCSVCDPTAYYNATTRSCVPRPVIYISNNTNNLLATNNVTVPQYFTNVTNTINNNQNAIFYNCPDGTQYSNYQGCFNCVAPNQYFNVQTFTCVPCPTYDASSQTCPPPIPRYPNLNNSNWGSSNITGVIDWRDQLKSVNGSQICPIETPHYNGQVCLTCSAGQYFNYDTKQCSSCPSGQAFDINVRKCLVLLPVGQYQTNINSSNLIYGGVSKAQWQSLYDSNRTAYPNIQDCPTQTPYYDGINCIQCPPQIPYFDLQYRLCMTCPSGTTYSDTGAYKGCLTPTNERKQISPDIAKMFSNIF